MRVLVTSRLYPSSAYPSRGTFVHNQVRFLRAHCELEVISPTPWFPPLPGSGRWSAYGRVGRRESLDGIEVRYPRYLSLPRRMLFSHAWRFYFAALQRAVSATPDLIHAHLAYPDGFAALQYGRSSGRPVVISVHGHDVRELPRAKRRWREMIAMALDQAAAVVASSRDIVGCLLDLGVAEEKVRLIPQGVDCSLFRPTASRRAGEGGWRLLYAGRFDRKKGLGVLLEAMALLRQRRDDVQLKLIGGSPMSGTAKDFRLQAEQLGLAECVEFVDEQPWAKMPGQMAAADLFVLPSFYDSFGIVLIEAMACGLPVVATRCGGPQEIVEEEVGELVEVGDAPDLARGIGDLLDNYERYDRAAIRRRVEERYDYRRLAARIYQVYEEVLETQQSFR